MKLKNALEKVNAFLDNKLIVRKGFDPIDISQGINWDHQHSKNANTYQTYLHSLGILTDLLIISTQQNKPTLEKYALDLFLDWNSKSHNNSESFAWKEHPVSSRLNNVIEFQNKSKEFKIPDEIFEEFIVRHCEFLNEEKNYRFNNHGLMMDYSLLNAADYIKDRKVKSIYTDKALYRVRYALRRDFTRRGVHLENSPEYHRMVLVIYKKIERKLKDLRIPLGKQETVILKLAQEFKHTMIQPNNQYPIIGDTGEIHDTKIKKDFRNFYDSESGIGIFNNKNEINPGKSTMLTFKSGYFNKTHKHYDDLSLTFYINGLELLVDSGKYSYNIKDPIRKHLVSPYGHNTLCISKKMYKLVNPYNEQSKLKLTGYRSKKKYIITSGINKLYDGIHLTRYNILTKENLLIVIDRAIGREVEEFQQNFNLNEAAIVSKIDELKYEVNLEEESFILKTFERYDTNLSSSIEKGYVSRKFGEYKENKRVVFKQNTKNATFITVIFNKKMERRIGEVKLQNNKIYYSIDEETVIIDI